MTETRPNPMSDRVLALAGLAQALAQVRRIAKARPRAACAQVERQVERGISVLRCIGGCTTVGDDEAVAGAHHAVPITMNARRPVMAQGAAGSGPAATLRTGSSVSEVISANCA